MRATCWCSPGPTAGRLPVRLEPLEAGELLSAAAGRAAAAAAAAGRTVATDAEPGVVVLADPDRAAQALDNLVANALAYGDGEVRLAARVERRIGGAARDRPWPRLSGRLA